MNLLLILLGKLIPTVSRFLNVGNGSTWPGHISLSINKNFIKEIVNKNPHLQIILIAGTNGKTTTGKLIQTILEKANYKVFQNESGANLLNGIASSLIQHSNIVGEILYDFVIFEIDENTLPLILKQLTADYIILLNLFRDQLDRYGEVNTVAAKWKCALNKLPSHTKLILNADDPQIAYLASHLASHLKGVNVKYFGIDSIRNKTEKYQYASDSVYCPNCGEKLIYDFVYFSHLGNWACKKCGCKHPTKTFTLSLIYPLSGTYNEYNTNAAVLLAKEIGIRKEVINSALQEFKPAFGRQEILHIKRKKVQIFLSKNPTSFNESLRAVTDLGAKNLLIVLNDRIPDGRDVSWIWDVDFEDFINKFQSIIISGDRAYDMGLRIKYSIETQKSKFKGQNYNSKVKIYENLDEAIKNSLKALSVSKTLYILPTYSAMLEVRKILTGKKIL